MYESTEQAYYEIKDMPDNDYDMPYGDETGVDCFRFSDDCGQSRYDNTVPKNEGIIKQKL